MTTLAGFTPTGRSTSGPGARLLQVENEKGLAHTAVVFDEIYRDSPALTGELVSTMPFLEKPGVSGVVGLRRHDRDAGAFVYGTGTVWSIAEVVAAFADLGEKCGHRAGLELAYVTSQILVEAADKGSPHGVWSHGSLSPGVSCSEKTARCG